MVIKEFPQRGFLRFPSFIDFVNFIYNRRFTLLSDYILSVIKWLCNDLYDEQSILVILNDNHNSNEEKSSFIYLFKGIQEDYVTYSLFEFDNDVFGAITFYVKAFPLKCSCCTTGTRAYLTGEDHNNFNT